MLSLALNAYNSLATLRERRHRLVSYAFGDHWKDAAYDSDGIKDTEHDILTRQGRNPVTINLLRRLVRTLVGRYRNEYADDYEKFELSIGSHNCIAELDARLLEEFIISGCAVQRISSENRPAGKGVWIDNVDPRRFFVNRFSDPRGADIELVGMFHDFSWPRFYNSFCRHRSEQKLRAIFSRWAGVPAIQEEVSSIFDDSGNVADDKIQICELWTFEPEKPSLKNKPLNLVWRQRFIAPDGSVIFTAVSPFAHGAHPFAVKLYPLIDGEVHSFLEDLIDPQRAINRLMTSFETAMATSAKGVLLFPEEQLTGGMDVADVAQLWAHPDAVIPIRGGSMNQLPLQMYSKIDTNGIMPAVQLHLQLLEEASGLSGILKGSGLSSSLGPDATKAIVSNADAALADLTRSFRAFTLARNQKALRALPR